MENLFHSLMNLNHWQIDSLVVCFLLQGAVFAIFPEEVIVVTMGILWGQNKIGFFEALLAVQLGLLPANFAMAYLGRKFGIKIFSLPPFCYFLRRDLVDRASESVRQQGARIVFITRFIPTIRGPVYLAAGMSKMDLKKFVKVDALASCIHIPLLLVFGAFVRSTSSSSLEMTLKFVLVLAALLLTGSILLNLRNTKKTLL